MKEDQFSLDETTLSVDLSDATQAVKESRFEDALNLLKVLLKENPNHIDILYLSAVSTRFLKQFEVSLKHIERLLFNAPDMGRAYQELGHLNRDMGNEEKAVMHYRQACELNPALPSSWSYLHKYFEKIQNKPAADHALEQIKKLQSLPGLLLFIEQILNEGRLGLAETKCRAFLKENPTHTYAMSLLAEIANRFGYFDDAEFLLQKAVEFKPKDGDLRLKYASILRKKQKFAQTTEQVNILCDQFPDNLNYQAQKASDVMQGGDHSKAITMFDDILKKNPYNFSTLTSKGHAQKTLGSTDQAIKSYQSAYQIKPDHGEAFFSLANLKTYSFSDYELDSMRQQVERVDLSLRDKAYFHFALAQGCEVKGEYEEAFFHLDRGNQIKNDQSKYSIENMEREFQAQIDICNDSFFKELGQGGNDTKDPIFILGLPRAGSTLIEQILASHSMVDGTLELPNILSMAQSLRGDDIYGKEGNYPKSMESLTLEQREAFGKNFIEDTRMHRKDAPMFTDKMPNNFRHIGLIHLIMPNAKIIDARRYPLDCCFSMFKQLFAQGQEFTYGLEEAGSYYNSYVKLMNHWDEVLPGKVLRVNNEDVVDDLEGQVTRMLEFIEIPFEEECISFYKTERLVRTPSSEQVRKPVNKDGMERWKPYAKYLKPLLNVLDEDLLKPEDVAYINK
ncbi:MAG: sulfotransferase [Gammaproteobacteria bacterium]|tara:strand:+ start:170 stop:2200 length:2031 start_codon:yes stop_codon:yes gene_type:complete